MKPNKIGKRLSEKVLRNAHIGREQAPPVPSNASLEQAMPVPYNFECQNIHDFSESLGLDNIPPPVSVPFIHLPKKPHKSEL